MLEHLMDNGEGDGEVGDGGTECYVDGEAFVAGTLRDVPDRDLVAALPGVLTLYREACLAEGTGVSLRNALVVLKRVTDECVGREAAAGCCLVLDGEWEAVAMGHMGGMPREEVAFFIQVFRDLEGGTSFPRALAALTALAAPTPGTQAASPSP